VTDKHRNFAAAILAGGRNSRMGGVDKAFLKVGPETVFERSLRVLNQCFEEIVVVSNRPEKYDRFRVRIVSDEFVAAGPLAGIHAALGAVRSPNVFIVACDMPFLRVEPIELLLRHCTDSDAVIPSWDGDIEPLHAVYSVKLRAPIAQALQQGVTAIRDFLPSIRVTYLPESLVRACVGSEEAFRNVNTPEDALRYAVEVRPEGELIDGVGTAK